MGSSSSTRFSSAPISVQALGKKHKERDKRRSLCKYLPNNIAEVFFILVCQEVFFVDNEDIDLEKLVRLDWLCGCCGCGRCGGFRSFQQVDNVKLTAVLHFCVERDHLMRV